MILGKDISLFALLVGAIIITLIITAALLYFYYLEAKKKILKAQRDATLAAKGVCTAITTNPLIKVLGSRYIPAQVIQTCNALLTS